MNTAIELLEKHLDSAKCRYATATQAASELHSRWQDACNDVARENSQLLDLEAALAKLKNG